MAAAKKVSVTLETLHELKGNVKFDTETPNVSPNNIYMRKEAWEKLGKPAQIKVTVEAA